MLSKIKLFTALVLGLFCFNLFYELDYYFIKSAFYMIRNRIY